MVQNDVTLLKGLMRSSEKELFKILKQFLIKNKYYPVETADYLFAEGDIPVLLVAHLDTVHQTLPFELYYDERQQVMWSPQGLGADDRAGVFAIIKILQSKRRPHILFTNQEELGGIGAYQFVSHFPEPPFLNLKYIIQLDRRGINDCVFYDCNNPKFETYIQGFGFETAQGIFSDISILCPFWNIAGVNLSVGYINEHSYIERLFLKPLYQTIEKVQKILDDHDKAEYYTYSTVKYYKELELDRCDNCHRQTVLSALTIVQTDKKNKHAYYCPQCTNSIVQWCHRCGAAFVGKENHFCYDCRGNQG